MADYIANFRLNRQHNPINLVIFANNIVGNLFFCIFFINRSLECNLKSASNLTHFHKPGFEELALYQKVVL